MPVILAEMYYEFTEYTVLRAHPTTGKILLDLIAPVSLTSSSRPVVLNLILAETQFMVVGLVRRPLLQL